VLANLDDEVWLAFGDRDGVVVASTRVGTGPGSSSQGWIVESDTAREIVEEGSRGVLVYELTHVGGAPVVIYGPIRELEDGYAPQSTPIVVARVDDSDRWELGNAFAPEWGVESASVAAGFVVFTASSDLTESVITTRIHDPLVLEGRFAPEPPYGMPPLVTSAVLHPDGSELAWIEGPDWDGATQMPGNAPWQLVVADAETGVERFRRSVLTSIEGVLHVERVGDVSIVGRYVHLEWDGDTAIISRFEEPPMLVDTSDASAPLRAACDLTGVATLPRPR
jgi:hypothetical protein